MNRDCGLAILAQIEMSAMVAQNQPDTGLCSMYRWSTPEKSVFIGNKKNLENRKELTHFMEIARRLGMIKWEARKEESLSEMPSLSCSISRKHVHSHK